MVEEVKTNDTHDKSRPASLKNNAHKEASLFEASKALSFMQFKFMMRNKRSPVGLNRKSLFTVDKHSNLK